MSRVLIYLHADPAPADFETSDKPTIDALRTSFPHQSQLVMASEARDALTKLRPLWAATLGSLEESSMVTIAFTDDLDPRPSP
jgi:hypothetical protein